MAPTELGIAGYQDLREVNRGGFATVYRGWQPTFEREVAIKLLEGRADDGALRRFRRECAAVGALSGHPNIVTVYDAGITDDGRLYLVMEYLAGGSFAERVGERGPLAAAAVLDLGVRVAGAIESVHRAGVLHRDLKPENVLLSRLGEPKVADFGLAQLAWAHSHVSGGLTGTVAHAAPEVLAGEETGPESDVYSLASTLFFLLAGHPPFGRAADTSLVTMLARIANDAPPDLRALGVPDALWRVIEQGLAKAPADRQGGAAQLGRQLQAAQAALGHPVTPLPIETVEVELAPRAEPAPTPAPPLPTPRPRRRRAQLVVAAALALATMASLVVALVPRPVSPLPMLYQDNFDAGQNWYEHDDEGGKLAYEQGHYGILVKRSHDVVLSDTSFRGGTYGEPLTALTDVSIRVRAQAATPGAVFGLFCRYQTGRAYYQAVVRTDGQALLLKVGPGVLKTLARGTLADVGTGRYVSLRLDCTGSGRNHVAFFGDGRKIAEATDRDQVRAGSVGMLASAESPPADVAFDDFVLLGRRQR